MASSLIGQWFKWFNKSNGNIFKVFPLELMDILANNQNSKVEQGYNCLN